MLKTQMKIATTVAIVGGMMAAAVSASAALNLPTQNCSYSFSTNMRLGSRGADVMNLQKILNMFPQTQVATSGAGSPGNETSTFGPATRAAANAFQRLHLVELGISSPTGNVFAGTRGLLNQICVGNNGNNGGNNGNNGGNTNNGPVSANLSASQPTGLLVQGQSGARLADISFTGNGTVTSVRLQRTGVSTDSTLVNVYLYDGNTRITDAASVTTGGFINFNAPNGLFTVSGSRTITVRADISSSSQGQSVGVKLNSVTAGGAVSTFSNVMGNSLQIANVTTATVNFPVVAASSTTVDAGTVNYAVWSGSATVSTRDVLFRAATFKFVGSAPVDFANNLSLYVDGTRVAGPSFINASNNNKVTFDLGATPFLLKTGSHTVEVRGDIVKGSNRTATFSVENVADLMFEDSNLAGVNVSATVAGSALNQSNSTYRLITINTGSVTVNVDPAFSANKVTGGAANVPIAQFVLKAYGEDVKVNSLTVTPTLTGAAISGSSTAAVQGLSNVSLFANGGQVGTSQNFVSTSGNTAGTALTYNLGSSLIIPAGQTVTLTVKADIVNANSAAYTAGTISAAIAGTNNAQGQSSSNVFSISTATGNVLTVSSGAGTFARTSGFTGVTVSPNTSNVKIGSFTLQANSAEDVRVNSIGVNPVVSGSPFVQTNISNLRVVSGGVTVGTPVGNPAAGTSTFSFGDITVPANSTRTFDVFADIGSATSGTVTTGMDITYRGAISNTTTVSTAGGIAITASVSSLAASTLSASSPVAQFVVGGSTFGIATFTLKTSGAGTVANVRELRFSATGTDAIASITVGGVTAPVVSGTSTVTGLSIPVSSTGTDVPVTVTFAGFQNSTTGGNLAQSVATTSVTLSYVEATSGSGTVITNGTLIASNNMILVASKPTVAVSAGNTNTLILGAESKVGEFTVIADANGKISVATTTMNVTAINITSPTFASFRVADGNSTITGSSATSTTSGSTATVTIGFNPNYEIAAGQTKVFSVYGVVGGTQAANGSPYVASSLTASGFQWRDVVGGNTLQSGATILNFPTNSYTTSR